MPGLYHYSRRGRQQIGQRVGIVAVLFSLHVLIKGRFCNEHQPSTQADEEAWKLHRDITHALILPVIGLYQHASRLATSLLGNDNIFDLELLFRGEARGAFAWLQCFIVDEEVWCNAQGCPGESIATVIEPISVILTSHAACNVSVILDAEPTIRMVLLACRLSHSLRRPHEDSNLPVLDFWLDSLSMAMHKDSFWGPELWIDINKRASMLESGIHELIRQCFQLEHLAAELPPLGQTCLVTRHPSRKLKRSRTSVGSCDAYHIAHKQDREMQKLVLGCWTTLLADATKVERKSSSAKRRPSLRTVTTLRL